MFSGTAGSALITLQGPWLGNERTEQHVALFYLNKDTLFICSMLKEEMICSSARQLWATFLHWVSGRRQERGRPMLPSAAWMSRLCFQLMCVEFLNVLYKKITPEESLWSGTDSCGDKEMCFSVTLVNSSGNGVCQQLLWRTDNS